jgi:hypothetical protein
MLKIVLLAYSRGMVSSRAIERACRENVLFIAISGDNAPQFTTIAKFVRELGSEIAALFQQVLMTCDAQGLIGRHMFAIDGVKLSSNASKHRSGTHDELAHRAERMEQAVARMLDTHRQRDVQTESADGEAQARQRSIERLQSEARRIRNFLLTQKERKSAKGAIRKSNVTDNDSAKMATSTGVLQGYTAIVAVDSQHQVIVAAQAHGSGSEQTALLPMVRSTDGWRTNETMITADAGYHSEVNLKELHEAGIPALIADGMMRKRDERFKDQAKYKAAPDPLYDKTTVGRTAKSKLFRPADFQYDAAKVLPHAIHTHRMRQAIDSDQGRALYGRRMATVEPVFGNLRANKRLDRFTLRGQAKVSTHWDMYCLVHNIEKLAYHGYAR